MQKMQKKKGQKEKKPKTGTESLGEPMEPATKENYIYVYGIVNNEDNEDFSSGLKGLGLKKGLGLRDKPIKKFDFRDIAVLVSDYPVLYPAVEEEEVMLHAEILNRLAKKLTIIPMAFGTVFKNKEILENILVKSYQPAKSALKLIKDKIELGVKVVKKGSELDEPAGAGLTKEILEPLSKLAVKTIYGDKFSERLLLNNSFLVEKKRFREFSAQVGGLEEKYPELKFLYTGPWPPYSFVNIKVNGS